MINLLTFSFLSCSLPMDEFFKNCPKMKATCNYGCLCQSIFLTFGYERLCKLRMFGMTKASLLLQRSSYHTVVWHVINLVTLCSIFRIFLYGVYRILFFAIVVLFMDNGLMIKEVMSHSTHLSKDGSYWSWFWAKCFVHKVEAVHFPNLGTREAKVDQGKANLRIHIHLSKDGWSLILWFNKLF